MIRQDSIHPLLLLDVRRILRSAGCVYAEDEAQLLIAAFEGADLEDMVYRRASGIPLEQLLGWAEFCGIRVTVGPGVFVPRRRTELLVEQAASLPIETVVDICCGSGAVGAALASAHPGIELHCTDVDPVALEFARINVGPLGGQVHEGDLYAALPLDLRGSVDVVVANAPYVPTDEIGSMPSEARDHEPMVALDGGVDGLAVQRRVAADASRWLVPGGHLLIETSALQAPETASLVRDAGFDARVVCSDELDATVVVGTIPTCRH